MHQQSIMSLNYSLLLDYSQVEARTYKSLKIQTSPGNRWRDVRQRTRHDGDRGRLLRRRGNQLHGIPRAHRRFWREKRHQRSQQESPLWEAERKAAEHRGFGMLLEGPERGWRPTAASAQVQIEGVFEILEFFSSIEDVEMVPRKIYLDMTLSEAFFRPFVCRVVSMIHCDQLLTFMLLFTLLLKTDVKHWQIWDISGKIAILLNNWIIVAGKGKLQSCGLVQALRQTEHRIHHQMQLQESFWSMQI